jgi:anti-sigma factor RsiW
MSTDHQEVDEVEVQALVDGRLDPRRHAEVLARLGEDPVRLEKVTAYARHTAALREEVAALEPRLPDAMTLRLQAELGAALERPRWLPLARRAAAVVLLLGAGWASHDLIPSLIGSRLPPVVIEAAQAHQVFAEDRHRPVELAAAARREMVAWFSHHLGEPVEIPSLHAVGLRLVGGRLLAAESGPVAQLIYEDRSGHRLTLCLTSSTPAAVGGDFQTVELDGLTAGYWQDGELTYAVVAATSEQELAAIASEAGAPDPEALL